MARSGVTFAEVDEAARYLQGLGRNPTVDSIRERLGTGSNTTLVEHLRRWKSMQGDGEGKIPQPLLEMVSGLWESLKSQSQKIEQEQRETFNQEISVIKSQLQTAAQTEKALNQKLHQLQEGLSAEQHHKSELEKNLRLLEKERDKLDTLHQAALKQIEDTKSDNQRLHQLTIQIQNNLEHYQNAIQQQQLEHNLEKEKQQAAYSQELSRLNSSIDEKQALYAEKEKLLLENQLKLQQIQTGYEKLNKSHEQLLDKQKNLETLVIQLQLTEKNQQRQLEKNQQELLAEHNLSQSLNQQVALLTDKLQKAQEDLTKNKDKVSTLRQEKMFLVQEKSQLEGALKQLQIIKESKHVV